MNDPTPPLDLNEIAGLIRATPQTLRQELTGLGSAVWQWRPAPDQWCINEVIGHLIEADRNGFDGRIRTILAADKPEFKPWDIGGVVAKRRDCERDAFDLIEELIVMRKASAQLVVGLTPELLNRSGIHPQVGELRVVDLIYEWVHHDQNHLKQALSNIQAFVWPHMGNARRFSDLD
jgi:hypothetical protein